MSSSNQPQSPLLSISVALPVIILFITALSLPLSSAPLLDLSPAQISAWVFAHYGLVGLLSVIVTFIYKQPILFTGNLFILIFVFSLGAEYAFAELIGASIVAGGVVVLLTILGLNKKLAQWIPAPIVFGLLAGAVMPLVSGTFTSLGESPLIVGGVFITYLLSRRMLKTRVPPILPALLVGLVLSALTFRPETAELSFALPLPEITRPIFSLSTITSITPIFVVLITLQANLPSLVFVKSKSYEPPERLINLTSGVFTVLGSFLGPMGASLSLPLTSIVAGDNAGDLKNRHKAVYYAAGMGIVIGILGGLTTLLIEIVPLPFLLAVAGLSLFDVLANALRAVFQSDLFLGALMTFVVVLSDISLFGLGSFFWALVIGITVSFFLEREALLGVDMDNE